VDENSKDYEFVGGSMDGQKVRIGGSIYVGSTFPGTVLPGHRREIYQLNHDGKFEFTRYGLDFNPRLGMPDAMDDFLALREKIDELFKDLDAYVEKYGGPDGTVFGIGNWVVKHKDA
jgi:hypothetical protein